MEIRTETQYNEALKRLYWLIISNPDAGTPEANEIDSIVEEIEEYETYLLKKED